jgi:carbon-monoxide dehydrogenase large subunit
VKAPRVAAERFTGSSVRRTEDLRLLTGRGQFVADIRLPGMLHCAFARSTLAHARVLQVETEAAARPPGWWPSSTAGRWLASPRPLGGWLT